MTTAEQLLNQTLRAIEDEEHWNLCFPDLYPESLLGPKVTNIKKLYETTSNDRKHLLRAAWNEYIKEKAESATAEFKAVIPRTMKPIPEVEPVYKLFISIALMAVGFYLVGWIGVGIGIVVLLLLLIHHNIWEIEYGGSI